MKLLAKGVNSTMDEALSSMNSTYLYGSYPFNNDSMQNGTEFGYYYEYYDYPTYFTYPPDHPLCHTNNSQVFRDTNTVYTLCMHTLLPILCAIGIVGIILTVIVLSKKSMSTSTNCYLISLAVTDMLFLLVLLVTRTLETRLGREAHYWYLIVRSISHIVQNTFLFASVWLTVMLAIERYIAICHPLRAMSICTVVRARIIICLIFLVAVIFHIPDMLKFRITNFWDPCLGKKVPRTDMTELGMNQTYRFVYNWISCLFLAIIPFLLLLVLNGFLIREIHRSTTYLRCHLASDSNVQTIITGEEIKITLMLVSVVVVFFLCQAPYILLYIIKILHPDILFESYNLLTYVTILLLATRSSLNFILYCWFSEKFWNTFKRTLCQPTCLFRRGPTWLRARVWNHSDHGHSNNNRKISFINTKETTC